jgi:hypothetical protein
MYEFIQKFHSGWAYLALITDCCSSYFFISKKRIYG